MKASNLRFLVKQGVSSVWHNRVMSLASFSILLVCLLLIGLSVLAVLDIGIVIGSVEDRNEVLVYVNGDITQPELSHITDVISENNNVESVVFYSKEEAYADKKEEMPEFTSLFEYLDENPMPNTFRVRITDLKEIDVTVSQFQSIEGVMKVVAPYDFATFLIQIRNTVSVIGSAVIMILVVVSLIIIYNTARSSVFNRRKEINIMKYVGATNTFIRLPFLVEGVFVGLLAGAGSWLCIKFSYEALVGLFESEDSIWLMLGLNDVIQFGDVSLVVLLCNCLAGALLGALGTMFTMGRHLNV